MPRREGQALDGASEAMRNEGQLGGECDPLLRHRRGHRPLELPDQASSSQRMSGGSFLVGFGERHKAHAQHTHRTTSSQSALQYGARRSSFVLGRRASRNPGQRAEPLARILRAFRRNETRSRSTAWARLRGGRKALILMDAVRCPKHVVDRRIGEIARWFYSHLARLLYATACQWRPSKLADLREYVDHERKTHYLEGEFSEYIAPNWALHERESVLYVDIEGTEHGGPRWSNPHEAVSVYGSTYSHQPDSLCLVEAMDKVGIFTLAGLKATSEVWGQVEFIEEESRVDDHRLKVQLFERLDRGKLPAPGVTARHIRALVDLWRLPMYHLDFREVPTSLDEVEEERELVRHDLV